MRNVLKLVVLLTMGLFLQSCGFEVVDTGHRGVKTEFGKVVGESLPEGLYFYNPISTDIVELDIRTQKISVNSQAYSSDAQIVAATIEVNLNLNPNAAHTTYKDVGLDWANKIVGPILLGLTKEAIGGYKAVDLIANRNKVTNQILTSLQEKLATKSITLTNLEISNLDFDDSFEAAVRDKVIAVERAKESKNKTVRIEEEARQKVLSAKAEAESMRIRAKALTQNKSLVEYEAVQKWDGKLPEMMMGGGSVPFINLNTKKK